MKQIDMFAACRKIYARDSIREGCMRAWFRHNAPLEVQQWLARAHCDSMVPGLEEKVARCCALLREWWDSAEFPQYMDYDSQELLFSEPPHNYGDEVEYIGDKWEGELLGDILAPLVLTRA